MQLAHPLVARGVAEHSGFAADPFARLRRTLDASHAIVFGTRAQAERAAAGVRAVHERVTGPGYAANDPALLMWVHATLVDTALRVHARFLGPLPPAHAATYYEQSAKVAELLGVPRVEQPADLDAFRAYVRHMVATLVVGEQARRAAEAVLHPSVPWVAEPLFALARQLTVGLLPPPLRAGYGLSWDSGREAALLAGGLAVRQVLPRVPAPLRRARLFA